MTINVYFVTKDGSREYYKNKNNRLCFKENGKWFACTKDKEVQWEFNQYTSFKRFAGTNINVVSTKVRT